MYKPERYIRGSKFNRRAHDRVRTSIPEMIILVAAGAVIGGTIVVLALPL